MAFGMIARHVSAKEGLHGTKKTEKISSVK
jgi:hypothetical protein